MYHSVMVVKQLNQVNKKYKTTKRKGKDLGAWIDNSLSNKSRV